MAPSSLQRLAAVLAAPLVLSILSVPSAAPAQRASPFMDEFRKLMVLNAKDEMAALIQKHEPEAIVAIREIAVEMRDGSSEELEIEFDALRQAWERAYDSQFASMQYDYFALRLTGPFKREHRDLTTRFTVKQREFDAAIAAKDTAKYAGLALEFDAFGDQFSELGDHYQASQCYWTAAVLSDDALNGTRADYRRASEAWGLSVRAREEAELRDKAYEAAKARHQQLEADGFTGPPPEEAAPEAGAEPGAGTPATPSAPATPLGATFELASDIEAVQRPLYTGDSNFQIWPTVPMQAIGTGGVFAGIENSPKVLRTGANKAAVDVDGDGNGDVDIPLTGKITPVQVKLGAAGEQRDWGFLAVIGQTQDMYQGFRFNLGPDEKNLMLYVGPAASLVGTIAEQRVQVFDDNMDGLYGSPPKTWAHIGLVDGAYQPDMDSVLIGESKSARPWSRLQKIGGAWYELAPDPAGADLTYRPAPVETGTLQLDLKGPDVTWLVVRGMGDKADLFYDVADGGTNKVEVPTGMYELFAGQVASGKKAQMAKALVLPGSKTRTWRVGKGETVKLELGAPFAFEFAVQQDEETVTVVGPTIMVVGRGGETYQRLWNCVVQPEVLLRKAGSGKGKKEAELVGVGSQEELEAHQGDYRAAWFPVGEPIRKPSPGDATEVQLFQKKHKLFGKIESQWLGS